MTKPTLLKIEITTGDSRPIFKQIVDSVRIQISTGQLPLGSKLPSYRGLAQQLLINPNTIAKAYRELSTEGLIESRAGLGLFVVQNHQLISEEERAQKLSSAIDTFMNDTISLHYPDTVIVSEIQANLKKYKQLKLA
jgi:GntR family transcriptional regulator